MSNRCQTCKYWDKEVQQKPCCDCFSLDGGKIEFTEYVPAVEEKDDPVSHPNHYQSKSGLEVIDVIQAFTEDSTGVESYYTGNILKYMCRWKKKNGLEDLKKARQYLDWLIEIEDPDMIKEDVKRRLNQIYGSHMMKEPPKNGRYSMDDTDSCYGECTCKSKKGDCFVPSYKFDNSLIEKQVAVEIIWNQFCDAFLKALTEVSDEEKENKKDEE